MQKSHFLLAMATAIPSLAAQTITTTPAGYETVRGTSAVLYPFSGTLSPVGSFRYQEVHTTLRTKPLAMIKAANFRRDESTTTTTTAVARTAMLEFAMGHGDIERFAGNFAENYTGGRTVVFTRKSVNLADWQTGTGGGTNPEPWTNRFLFDVPFSYNGINDLVWEVAYDSMTPTGTYNADRVPGTGSFSNSLAGTALGTGCIATGRTSAFSLTATQHHHIGSKMLRTVLYVTNGPTTQPVVVHADVVDPNLSVPILCGAIRANPTLSIPLGVTSATGGTNTLMSLSIPFNSAFLTTHTFLQAVALDPGQAPNLLPVVLSQGRDIIWPALTVTTPAPALYTYNPDLTSAYGLGPFTAGLVPCGFEQ